MADYFESGSAAQTADNSAAPAAAVAQPAANGDVGMDDEVMVRASL
jgi:hypothetical protein